MKVLHIIPAYYPAFFYGGPIESVHKLCQRLGKMDCSVRVLTTDANGPERLDQFAKDEDIDFGSGLHVRYCRRNCATSVSVQLVLRLIPFLRWTDVVHLTGVYSFPTIPTLLGCRILRKPLVWSPRGALQRWHGSSRVKLKAAWESVCRITAPATLTLHVTSEEEKLESLKRFPTAKVVVIPNGVEIPPAINHRGRKGSLRLLYVGRLDPKKGIENLLKACARLRRNGFPFLLVVAGTGEAEYEVSIRRLIVELGLAEIVEMVGQVTGVAKQRLFENTDVVVVPSHTENFGMVVAEALAAGVPVIASKGTPWSRIQEIRCGLWVANDPDGLADAIESMSIQPLREMGERGREWMKKEFSWDSVSQQMEKAYRNLLS